MARSSSAGSRAFGLEHVLRDAVWRPPTTGPPRQSCLAPSSACTPDESCVVTGGTSEWVARARPTASLPSFGRIVTSLDGRRQPRWREHTRHRSVELRPALTSNVMSPNLAQVIDGKKFMWDGTVYESQEAASKAMVAYQQDNFEVRLVEEPGTFLVYTRRVVKEVVVPSR